jgi:hypothetical protein
MRHYTEDEWVRFNDKDCSRETVRLMEEHLRNCEDCRETFLSLVSGEDVARAARAVPRDFTQSVMRLIDAEPSAPEPSLPARTDLIRTEKNAGNRAWKRERLLTYYAAAAVLTLAFMGGGVFQALVDGYPDDSPIAIAAARNGQKGEKKLSVDLSEKIADKTNRWLNSFENRKQGGLDDE